MSKSAARLDDNHVCSKSDPIPHIGGKITTGSPNVTIGKKPAARLGDKIKCEDGSEGVISESNACLVINGQRAARINDKTSHDGKISSGMDSVQIADDDPFIEIGDEGIVEIGDNVIFGEAAAG